jgi:hypothetical protein
LPSINLTALSISGSVNKYVSSPAPPAQQNTADNQYRKRNSHGNIY